MNSMFGCRNAQRGGNPNHIFAPNSIVLESLKRHCNLGKRDAL